MVPWHIFDEKCEHLNYQYQFKYCQTLTNMSNSRVTIANRLKISNYQNISFAIQENRWL